MIVRARVSCPTKRPSVTYASVAVVKKIEEIGPYVSLGAQLCGMIPECVLTRAVPEMIQRERSRKHPGKGPALPPPAAPPIVGDNVIVVDGKDEAEELARELGVQAPPELPPAFTRRVSDVSIVDKAPCQKCRKLFSNEGLFEKGGFFYCREDYVELFFHKCKLCQLPIEKSGLIINGEYYHTACIKCTACKKQLGMGTEVLTHGGEFYCRGCEPTGALGGACGPCTSVRRCAVDSHMHAVPCAFCREHIKGEFIEAIGRKYHPECFLCNVCKKELSDRYFVHNVSAVLCRERALY